MSTYNSSALTRPEIFDRKIRNEILLLEFKDLSKRNHFQFTVFTIEFCCGKKPGEFRMIYYLSYTESLSMMAYHPLNHLFNNHQYLMLYI